MYWSYYPHRSRDSLSPVCGIYKEEPLYRGQLCSLPIILHMQNLWNCFWRGESLPRHHITCHSPFCTARQLSATTVARNSSLSKHMFVLHGAGRSTPTIASTDKRSFSLWGKGHHQGDYPQSECDGEEERKRTVLASFRKRADIFYQLH